MRTGIEKLAWLIHTGGHPGETTIGELAKIYDEPVERIMDALDVIKIVHGEPTQLPAVDWMQ
jgi:hypothetical protein